MRQFSRDRPYRSPYFWAIRYGCFLPCSRTIRVDRAGNIRHREHDVSEAVKSCVHHCVLDVAATLWYCRQTIVCENSMSQQLMLWTLVALVKNKDMSKYCYRLPFWAYSVSQCKPFSLFDGISTHTHTQNGVLTS
jgi:hypothetical protein